MDESTRQTAIAFLTSIPLSIKDACTLCGENVSQKQENSLHESPKNDDDRVNLIHVQITCSSDISETSTQHGFQYHRSISSLGGTASAIQIKPLQRQSSLKETKSCHPRLLVEPRVMPYYKSLKKPVTKIHLTPTPSLHSSRIFLLEPSCHTPCGVFSILPYAKDNEKLKSQVSSMKSFSMETPDHRSSYIFLDPLNLTPSNQVVSYESLLTPSKPESVVELDCAEWTSGKHRTVLEFSGYLVSVIGYTKPSELKRDLNQKFKQSFPGVHITLSKLRSLERLMLRTAMSFGIQSGVLSCAKSYFERLVFSCVVNKFNRHHIAATCLLLSAKIHGDLTSDEVSQLVTSLEHTFNTSKGVFLRFEFPIFAALKFSIMLPVRSRNMSGE